jgi:hypothetical protein
MMLLSVLGRWLAAEGEVWVDEVGWEEEGGEEVVDGSVNSTTRVVGVSCSIAIV